MKKSLKRKSPEWRTWYPAHTITFLLPTEQRVLFAALLGIVLGVLLAVSVKKAK